MLRFSGRHHLPLILQAEWAECGLACVAMVAGWFGRRESLSSLRARFGSSVRGSNLLAITDALAALDISSRAVRCGLDELGALALPAILHWDFNHFVVLKSVRGERLVLHDPAFGLRRCKRSDVGDHFTGIAVECTPTPAFRIKSANRGPGLTHYLGGIRQLVPALGQLIVLSAILQLVALATPFYMQLVVDEVVARQDVDLLTILAIGFGALAMLSAFTRALRGWTGIYLNNQLSFMLGVRLFRHLLALPAGWFARRQMGDIVSRFSSLKPLQEFVSNSAITVVLDGAMAVTTLSMLYVYSPLLASLVVVLVVIQTGSRLALFPVLRQRSAERIAADARTDSNFMETVRNIAAIKRYVAEEQRNSDWQNRFSDAINAGIRVDRFSLGLDLLQQATGSLGHVLLVYVGARQVLAGEFSIGMLYAFFAYRQHLGDAVASLVAAVIKYIMLSLHLERLADITLTEPEPRLSGRDAPEPKGRLFVDRASFRYGSRDRWLFRKLSFELAPGESLAIVGPSGCGKSTLLNAILGILPLDEGRVQLDGIDTGSRGLAILRRYSASVMQEDTLLAGSIQSNITFGSTAPDVELMQRAAGLACIHDDIVCLPMGYDTLVGEMGAALSAGQIQRVLIARALYHQPRLLFLDEATAHLDKAMAHKVMANILGMGITCIFISHNREIARLADKALLLGDTTPRLGRIRPPQCSASRRTAAAS